uniref:transmembrane protein 135-like n=1 Tax=Styela clava TaxID=7725 RepID=UPI0019393E93|nr:transmembrane protein 135-like [Styela clava]
MVVLSKMTDVGANTLGPFDAIDCTCYEMCHTWNSSCMGTYVDTFHKAFVYAFKVYAPLYLLNALWKLQKKRTDKKRLARNTILQTLRSTLFLTMNGTWVLMVVCAYGKIFGKFHGVSGFIVGLISSFLSIIIERKSRRGLLAIYITNLALEILFKMSVSRGYVTPINRGEIYLFALSNVAYMSYFRGSNLPSYLQSVFEKVLGNDETKTYKIREEREHSSVAGNKLIFSLKKMCSYLLNNLNSIGSRPPSCCHGDSCVAYSARAAIKYFSIGYGIQVLMNYRRIFQALLRSNLSLLGKSFSDFRLAKFFCAYVTVFRAINCLLRRAVGQDNPEFFGGIAGFFSGFSALFYPSTTLSLYAVTKLLDIFCMKAVATKRLPFFPNFDVFMYSLSMGIVYHASIFEPHNIRPSYWSFMKGLSGYKFPLLFRKLLDRFGTEATKMYPNFVPDLDPKYVITPEVQQVLASHGKWP